MRVKVVKIDAGCKTARCMTRVMARDIVVLSLFLFRNQKIYFFQKTNMSPLRGSVHYRLFRTLRVLPICRSFGAGKFEFYFSSEPFRFDLITTFKRGSIFSSGTLRVISICRSFGARKVECYFCELMFGNSSYELGNLSFILRISVRK